MGRADALADQIVIRARLRSEGLASLCQTYDKVGARQSNIPATMVRYQSALSSC